MGRPTPSTGRVSCFATPEHPRCRALMQQARARQARDAPLFAECTELGDRAFNRKYRDRPALQRSDDCAYQRRPTGAERWPRLLEGACPAGSYVGREAEDCCSGDLAAAAALWPECVDFFPAR